MKISLKNLIFLFTLVAGFGPITTSSLTAQTFTNLHSLSLSDGIFPVARLVFSGNTVYGTAPAGGNFGQGTLFAINTDSGGFTNLHSFSATSGGNNSDGAASQAGLVLSGNTLYGTARFGGTSGQGTVFSINIDGSGFTNLHSFTALPFGTNSDGANPFSELILSGNTLYGTAQSGGSKGLGTVFAVNTDGTGFTNLHSFINLSDGSEPRAGMVLSGSTLFGTARAGGSANNGTVFAINTNGTGFTNLHSFTATSNSTNSDGTLPISKLILSGNTLYGTAFGGGASGQGTVFALNADGTGFTNLHSFAALNNSTNSEGGQPSAGLILLGNTLYGTAPQGGSSGNGTVFAVNTNGKGFTTMHSFSGTASNTNSDGAFPLAALISSGNTLYGTADTGGSSGKGTVFSLTLPTIGSPQVTIVRAGTNVILTWTNGIGFTLQSAPAVTGTFTNITPVANSPFTNTITGAQRFFRFSQ